MTAHPTAPWQRRAAIVDRDRLDALAALAEAIESRRHTNEQWTAWGTARQPATILSLIAEVRELRATVSRLSETRP